MRILSSPVSDWNQSSEKFRNVSLFKFVIRGVIANIKGVQRREPEVEGDLS